MELLNAFYVIFEIPKDKIQTSYHFELKNPRRKLPKLNKLSSSESKIKYYRRLHNITQKELAEQLGVTREVILTLENGPRNGKRTFYDSNIINRIVDILDMRDKFGKSDTYIKFLIEDSPKQIHEFRINNNLTKKQMGKLLEVSSTTIGRWETGENTMSYENFIKYKKIRDSLN